MKHILLTICTLAFLFSCSKEEQVPAQTAPSLDFSNAEFYQSLPKQKSFFQKIDKPGASGSVDLLVVNPDLTFQTIDGFGLALTGGSA